MPAHDAADPDATSPRRITVGLPVYNDADKLYASVPTVFAQSYDGPLRLLVVDDGSTDDTRAVLDDLAQRYGHIEVLTHERNLGRPFARNTIIEAAGDDLLAWIDADDLWHPRKLELQLAALAEADPDGTEAVMCTGPFRWVYRDQEQVMVRVPEVEGDQLFNVLSGALQPYLWALLGRAELFRAAGGFDERLFRRQDFEFMLRFVAGGGRVVRTDAATPLATYMKSDAGRSADHVSGANDVIWAKHRDLYRRYGRRFALEMRRSQHRLSARFHEHNDAHVERVRYAWRARRLDPVIWVTPPHVNVGDPLRVPKWLYWAARRRLKAVRNRARRTRWTMRRWRRQSARSLRDLRNRGAMAYARSGLPAATRGWGLARSLPLEAWVEEGPAATVIERVANRAAGAEPDAVERAWLQLEKLYRLRGELWSAEKALERGLAQQPGSVALTLRLVELLALRREWERCVGAWEDLQGRTSTAEVQEAMGATTYTRLARALRQLGRDAEAADLAAEGLERFPDDDRLPVEAAKARATKTDWAEAVRHGTTAGPHGATAGPQRTTAAAEAAPAEPVGVATSLGFLAGSEGPIQGWLRPGEQVGGEVALLLNGERVVATAASPPDEEGRARFSLSCGDLGAYLGDGDVLELAAVDGPIAWEGIGPRLAVAPGHPSRADDLIDRVRRGHVFNKFGQLRGGNSLTRKRLVLDLFDEIAAVLEERAGVRLVPFYGNLLGAIREHDFLPHDVGGFDVAYLSEEPTAEGVRAEFMQLCRILAGAGYDLRLEPFSAMVRRQATATHFIDINFCWAREDGGLGMSFGWRYEPVTDLEAFRAPRWAALADRLVQVPGNAEAVLHQIYGRGWLVPDQGFQLAVDLKRDDRYLLSAAERAELAAVDPDRVHLQPDPEEE